MRYRRKYMPQKVLLYKEANELNEIIFATMTFLSLCCESCSAALKVKVKKPKGLSVNPPLQMHFQVTQLLGRGVILIERQVSFCHNWLKCVHLYAKQHTLHHMNNKYEQFKAQYKNYTYMIACARRCTHTPQSGKN